MNEYDFALHYQLNDPNEDPGIYEVPLFEAGCDDALPGIGRKGFIGLDFIRESTNALEAIFSATKNVADAIPNSKLYYIAPDIVGITHIAKIMNCSRQNVLKLRNTHRNTFPTSMSDGKASLWHLAEVLKWYQYKGKDIDQQLLEIAEFAMQFNLNYKSKIIATDVETVKKAQALAM